MQVYKDEIFDLARDKKCQIFYNSSVAHASIVHKALVKYAQEYIEIFSSSMCTEISNNAEYVELIDGFLCSDSSHKVRIILTNPCGLDNPVFEVLKKHKDQVEVKKFDGTLVYNGNDAHFTVVDGRAFRLETNIEKHMAFGNFNNPNQAKSLHNVFEKTFSSPETKLINLA